MRLFMRILLTGSLLAGLVSAADARKFPLPKKAPFGATSVLKVAPSVIKTGVGLQIEKAFVQKALQAQALSSADFLLRSTMAQSRLGEVFAEVPFMQMNLFTDVEDAIVKTNRTVAETENWQYRNLFTAYLTEAISEMSGIPPAHEAKLLRQVFRLMEKDLIAAETRAFTTLHGRMPSVHLLTLPVLSEAQEAELQLVKSLYFLFQPEYMQDASVAELQEFLQRYDYKIWARKLDKTITALQEEETERAFRQKQTERNMAEKSWNQDKQEIINTARAAEWADLGKPVASTREMGAKQTVAKQNPDALADQPISGRGVESAPSSAQAQDINPVEAEGGVSAKIASVESPQKSVRKAAPKKAAKSSTTSTVRHAGSKWPKERIDNLLSRTTRWVEEERSYPRSSISLEELQSYEEAIPFRRQQEARLRMEINSFMHTSGDAHDMKGEFIKLMQEANPSLKNVLK